MTRASCWLVLITMLGCGADTVPLNLSIQRSDGRKVHVWVGPAAWCEQLGPEVEPNAAKSFIDLELGDPAARWQPSASGPDAIAWGGVEVESGQAVVVEVLDDVTCEAWVGCTVWDGEGSVDVAFEIPERERPLMECRAGADAGQDSGLDGSTDAGPPHDAALPPACRSSEEVIDVSTGTRHTCAVTASGDVYCWGHNEWGRADPPNAGNDSVGPTRIEGLPPIRQVSVGHEHSCALATAGTVHCWGYNGMNSENFLGNRENGPSVQIAVDVANASELSVGYRHSCAVVGAGQVWCWGDNSLGQLGLAPGGTVNRDNNHLPGRVEGTAGFSHVAAGVEMTCAWDTAADLVCWGSNIEGALGYGATDGEIFPVTDTEILHHRGMSEPIMNLAALAVSHSGYTATGCGAEIPMNGEGGGCAVGDGNVYCWGSNTCCASGDGCGARPHATQEVTSPEERIVSGGAGFDWLLGVGAGTSCVARRITAGGPRELFCWGDGQFGQLGGLALRHSPDIRGPEDTRDPEPLLEDVDAINIGGGHLCAISGARVLCWGQNEDGQAVPGGPATVDTPTCIPLP